MQWSDVLNDKSLEDLPYKIELNERGQIIMSPASNEHGMWQVKIAFLLKQQILSGEVITECSIDTEKGVKVPDVVWCSDDFINKHGLETPFTNAPEICVEILSPSNTQKEMDEKMKLYFNQGAKEVWIVTEKKEVRLYDKHGSISESLYNVRFDF